MQRLARPALGGLVRPNAASQDSAIGRKCMGGHAIFRDLLARHLGCIRCVRRSKKGNVVHQPIENNHETYDGHTSFCVRALKYNH